MPGRPHGAQARSFAELIELARENGAMMRRVAAEAPRHDRQAETEGTSCAHSPLMTRLEVFLGASFLVTWTCWGSLVLLARSGQAVYGDPLFMLLYMLGGLGPTLGAYAAVLATRAQSPLGEFHSRLLRFRVAGRWYLTATGLPVALALVPVGVAALVEPDAARALSVRPWYMLVPLFLVMIAGGGLEELGWRGVAQPELERVLRRPAAAVLVGLIWALWHLPLFVLPGVSQYETSFPVFAVRLVGGALILAWLYGCTESILLCVLFHAAWNGVAAFGLAIPSEWRLLAVLDACLRVAVGAFLLAGAWSRRAPPEAGSA